MTLVFLVLRDHSGGYNLNVDSLTSSITLVSWNRRITQVKEDSMTQMGITDDDKEDSI